MALRRRRSSRQDSIDHKGKPPTGFAAIPSHDRVTHISLETDQAAAVSAWRRAAVVVSKTAANSKNGRQL
jgi:hypothetical protein